MQHKKRHNDTFISNWTYRESKVGKVKWGTKVGATIEKNIGWIIYFKPLVCLDSFCIIRNLCGPSARRTNSHNLYILKI